MAEIRNVFSIGRRPNDEDQLTEMLGWLSSAVPTVAAAMVSLATDTPIERVEPFEFTSQVVYEGGRLDAVLKSPNAVVAMESKLGSAYLPGQLEKYLAWMQQKYADVESRALMTLTRNVAPWPPLAVERAEALGIRRAERRWEGLHDVLESYFDADGALEYRIAREFLDMLQQEGLVPVKPLTNEELSTGRWSAGREVIRHYHEFFRACKEAVAVELEAETTLAWSDQIDNTRQDYRLVDVPTHVVNG